MLLTTDLSLHFMRAYEIYDTIGGLFGDMYLGVDELTVVEKIWAIIIEVVSVVSELTGADSDELTIQIIENDKRLAALREYAQTA